MKISNLLAEIQGDFWTTVLPIFRYVLFFIIVACSIAVIVCSLLQSNDSSNGIDSVMGTQESYYAQNKGSSRDGKLKIAIIVLASVIFVCVILFLVTLLINGVRQ